ncbi:MAG: hypothetical protein AAGG51_18470 [Cyanobacteria bacterium P01_G01_bin.54]
MVAAVGVGMVCYLSLYSIMTGFWGVGQNGGMGAEWAWAKTLGPYRLMRFREMGKGASITPLGVVLLRFIQKQRKAIAPLPFWLVVAMFKGLI